MQRRQESRTTRAALNEFGPRGKASLLLLLRKGGGGHHAGVLCLDSETIKLEFPPQHLNCNEGHTMTRVEFPVCDLAHMAV